MVDAEVQAGDRNEDDDARQPTNLAIVRGRPGTTTA